MDHAVWFSWRYSRGFSWQGRDEDLAAKCLVVQVNCRLDCLGDLCGKGEIVSVHCDWDEP